MGVGARDASTYTAPVPMTDRSIERTLRAFSDDLASDSPVPGGGSAAAYAGALAAALAAMIGRIAAKKAAGRADRVAEVDDLRAALLRLVDEDAAAFAQVADAMKLPRSTDEEKRARRETLQTALVGAARVPLETAAVSRRVLESCERGMEIATDATVSDLGVAALLASAALDSAALNVRINLASIKDPERVAALSADLERTLDGTSGQRDRIIRAVNARIDR